MGNIFLLLNSIHLKIYKDPTLKLTSTIKIRLDKSTPYYRHNDENLGSQYGENFFEEYAHDLFKVWFVIIEQFMIIFFKPKTILILAGYLL